MVSPIFTGINRCIIAVCHPLLLCFGWDDGGHHNHHHDHHSH
ncbi:hypothetical protein Pint_35075 [Pistacia integerrima]|uniref:Uncharacterized protein n=1 Tax=Pistacia integerrima TaxID=434235 RepID=A0ACC0XZI7_9ROSI|nr:hypothetical protein Pint_35075 [Pistacia integerrima]